MSPTARVDHVVVAVPDLDDAVARWSAAGLPAALGGEHPGGTRNALVRGPRPAYVELITTGEDADGPWADRVRGEHGPLSWALAVDDLDAARRAVVDLGHSPGPIVDGARTTPDGTRLTWRLCEIGGPFDPQWPFLIQWETPMPPGPDDGAMLEHVEVSVADPEGLIALLDAVGLPTQSSFDRGAIFRDLLDVGVAVRGDRAGEGVVTAAFDVATHPSRRSESVALDGLHVWRHPGLRTRRGGRLWAEVERAYAALDLPAWPAPSWETAPEWAYRKVTDPDRYRALGARADVWLDVLVRHGVARVEELEPESVTWRHAGQQGTPPVVTSAYRLVPTVEGGLPLTVARSASTERPDTFVTIAGGEPALALTSVPDCGCDACDEGSPAWIRYVDEAVLLVLGGGALQFRDGAELVTRVPSGWTGAADRSVEEVEHRFAHPEPGDLAGDPWL